MTVNRYTAEDASVLLAGVHVASEGTTLVSITVDSEVREQLNGGPNPVLMNFGSIASGSVDYFGHSSQLPIVYSASPTLLIITASAWVFTGYVIITSGEFNLPANGVGSGSFNFKTSGAWTLV